MTSSRLLVPGAASSPVRVAGADLREESHHWRDGAAFPRKRPNTANFVRYRLRHHHGTYWPFFSPEIWRIFEKLSRSFVREKSTTASANLECSPIFFLSQRWRLIESLLYNRQRFQIFSKCLFLPIGKNKNSIVTYNIIFIFTDW